MMERTMGRRGLFCSLNGLVGTMGLMLLSSCGVQKESSDLKNKLIEDGIGLETICGRTNDLQDVETYNGQLGISIGFVDDHEPPVGAILNSRGSAFCSGTLISEDLFLTAAHCMGSGPSQVAFNYQVGGGGVVRYNVTAIVEEGSRVDYAILRLAGSPGDDFGFATIADSIPSVSETTVIIQHPSGGPKKVEVGNISRITSSRLYYSGLDTLGGSSGSGIINTDGELVGVHTHGGCTSSGGSNSGTNMNAIKSVSNIIY